MLKRLLIAVPVAAIVVAALFWAMREFVFAEKLPVYTIRLCHNCYPPQAAVLPRDDREIVINGGGRGSHRPPDPTPVPPEPIERQAMPREPFPAPKGVPPDELPFTPAGAMETRCKDGSEWEPTTCCSVSFPEHARDGDYVVVEFDLDSEGLPKDLRIVETSNPDLDNRDTLTTLRILLRSKWRYRNCVKGKSEQTEGLRTRFEFEKDKDRPPAD